MADKKVIEVSIHPDGNVTIEPIEGKGREAASRKQRRSRPRLAATSRRGPRKAEAFVPPAASKSSQRSESDHVRAPLEWVARSVVPDCGKECRAELCIAECPWPPCPHCKGEGCMECSLTGADPKGPACRETRRAPGWDCPCPGSGNNDPTRHAMSNPDTDFYTDVVFSQGILSTSALAAGWPFGSSTRQTFSWGASTQTQFIWATRNSFPVRPSQSLRESSARHEGRSTHAPQISPLPARGLFDSLSFRNCSRPSSRSSKNSTQKSMS